MRKLHEKPFKCTECGIICQGFLRVAYLQIFKAIKEPGHSMVKGPKLCYHCTQCDKCFTCLSHVYRHMRTHTGTCQKPTSTGQYNQCDVSFRDSSDLQKHKRTHSGNKPCKYNKSTKGFAQLTIRISSRALLYI